MNIPDWKPRTKKRGQTLVKMTIKVTPGFQTAIREFSERQARNSGVNVGIGVVIETTLKQAYSDVRRRTDEENKKIAASRDKRYINGIKSEG